MDPIIYRFLPCEFFASSDLVILRATSNIFVSPNHHFSGLLQLVLGRGTHLLLYLLGAKFSDLTCHPAGKQPPSRARCFSTPPLVPKKNIETQHPAHFQVKKNIHPSKKKKKKRVGLRQISHPTKSILHQTLPRVRASKVFQEPTSA